MRKVLFHLPLVLLLQIGQLHAASEAQMASISKMGELNGVALQCGLMTEIQKIKQTLVLNLPKKRELGLLFEEKTNASFLEFINEGKSCPGSAMFGKDLKQAIGKLEQAFKQ